jgi:hypothetical protein
MGGFGSGRYGGRATVEGCGSLVLDVDYVTRPIRQAMRKLGISEIPDGRVVELPWNAFRWTHHGATEPWATVEYRLELRSHDGAASLRYDVDHYSSRTGPQEHRVTLATTPCPFGGRRWWWICPATGQRVRKLYLPNGGTRFLSRGPGAYRLAYASQRHGWINRVHARSRRLYRRLGADYGGLANGFWPEKPKGMRWRTYNAICEQLEVEEGRLNVDLLQVLERLQRRTSG